MPTRQARSTGGRGALGLLLAGALLAPAAQADSRSVSGGVPLQAQVELRFAIQIDKFVYLRIGDGSLSSPGTPSTVAFTLAPSVPGGPASPTGGSNRPADWTGAVPSFTVGASGQVLPVEVRSNAGQVRLYATVTAPLASAGNTIPMSHIAIASDQASTLPAPTLPASGIGSTVDVAGGGAGTFSPLVTARSANWTFSLPTGNAASYAAGQYSGQLTFTAATL